MIVPAIFKRSRKARPIVSRRRPRHQSVPAIVELLEDRVLLAAQVVSPETEALTVKTGDLVAFDVNYDVTDPLEDAPNGLLLRIHYDSQALTFTSPDDVFMTGFDTFQDMAESVSDDDPRTDRMINFLWFSISGGWPADTTLPVSLLTAQFTAIGSETITDVRFTASNTIGYDFESTPVAVTITNEIVNDTLLSDLDEQHGFTKESTEFFDAFNANEKWVRAANNDWFFLLPNGDLVMWDRTAGSATGTMVASVGVSVYDDPSLLFDAFQPELETDPAVVDERLGFTSESTQFFNSFGANEKWLRAANNDWHFLLPDGTLLQWDRTPGSATGMPVAQFSTDVYDDTSLLFDAFQPVLETDPAVIDEQLGFTVEATQFFDSFGANEKWLRAANKDWYFLLPDGTLLRWDRTPGSATGTPVAKFSTDIYDDPSLLFNAQQLMLETDPAVVDEQLGFSFEATDSFNFGGINEKWLQAANGMWHFLQTDGTLVRWDGTRNSATGTPVASLGTDVYDDPSLLFNAHQLELETDPAVVDAELRFSSEDVGSFNFGGRNEKWLQAMNGQWHFLLPDGTLVRWNGTNRSAVGTAVAALGTGVYENPALLFDAAIT